MYEGTAKVRKQITPYCMQIHKNNLKQINKLAKSEFGFVVLILLVKKHSPTNPKK